MVCLQQNFLAFVYVFLPDVDAFVICLLMVCLQRNLLDFVPDVDVFGLEASRDSKNRNMLIITFGILLALWTLENFGGNDFLL